MQIKRRTVLSGLIGFSLPLIAASCTNSSTSSTPNSSTTSDTATSPGTTSAQNITVRIGYQKATELDLLRSRGKLDQRIKDLGGAIEWSLFPSGPPMLEAMNADKIDFGGVGESPPIFSQAAGGQFYYASYTPLSAATQDIVVAQNSPIQTPADLRGRKIAFQKGSSAHYLLLKVLEENNIPLSEIEAISLSPADARAAFEQGTVDAWSIWDPFLAVVQKNGNIRNLQVGRERRSFFLTAQKFAKDHADLLSIVLDEARQNGIWAKQNLKTVAQQFSTDVKIDAATLEAVYQRRSWEVLPVNEQIQEAQQQVADIFFKAQLIPKALQVKDTFLPSEEYTKLFPG